MVPILRFVKRFSCGDCIACSVLCKKTTTAKRPLAERRQVSLSHRQLRLLNGPRVKAQGGRDKNAATKNRWRQRRSKWNWWR